ncbi:MAG: thiaminase II [Nitrososphaerota archaeon]|nr:thiaminase II [Nitrososphaerota archaeon]
MTNQEKLTDKLWASITPIFQGILKHSFLKGLTSGKLQTNRFKEYVIQDSLYLYDFSKSLQLLTNTAPRQAWKNKFAIDSRIALEVERSLHESFFSYWRFDKVALERRKKNPSNTAYTSYILATTATRPFHEGVASVLPCYWIYLKVGRHLERLGSPNKLYQKWINTYSSEQYETGVNEALEIANSLKLTEAEEDACIERFRTAAIYEFMFWNAAYTFEKWKY